MTEKTYTVRELNEAAKNLGHTQNRFLERLAEQVDRKRAAKGFTEEQVREAVLASVREEPDGRVVTRGAYYPAASFANDVVNRLTDSQEYVEGGVYRGKITGTLYRRFNGAWEIFGSSTRLADAVVRTSELERVL